MSLNKSEGATGGATGDETDKALEEALRKVKASSEYKVLSKEDYDALLALAKKSALASTSRVTLPSDPVSEAAKPKFTFNTLTSTPRATIPSNPVSQGAKPKFTFKNPLTTPSPVPTMHQPFNASQGHNVTYVPQNFSFPKLPIFSGSEVPQKGEATYEVWSLEVKCLRNIQELPEYSLLQSIRNSLRGSARDVIIPLGENASVDEILAKLEGFYGIVSTGATLMQTFYNDFQKDSESIVSYGTRLEQTLSRAVTHGHIEFSAKDSILRSKFWTGLKSQQLKNSTRHLYDSIFEFQSLLKEIRKVESEEASCLRPTQKQKAQQQSGQAETESKEDKILKQLSDLMGRMKSMEQRLENQQKSADSQSSSYRSFQDQRGGYTNYNRRNFRQRGNFRGGYGRGSYNNTHGDFGRGYQGNTNDSQNDTSRGSFGGGRSRSNYRGGTSGRGANRGGTSNGSDQHLNF
ncbi:MAG: hypothetical protein JAY66_02630 [Candidatus Thiodiazotropha taylori]|nr:hypothetical protein [Candidatus Thiodiazotropha taylori]